MNEKKEKSKSSQLETYIYASPSVEERIALRCLTDGKKKVAEMKKHLKSLDTVIKSKE